MAFVIKNPPEFTLDIPQWDRETLADGVEMAKVPEALLNNEVYLLSLILRQRAVTYITLTAAGWTGEEAPYEQTVSVDGAEEGTEAVLVRNLADSATREEQKAYNKAYGIVSSGTAELTEGSAVFRVYDKPAIDLSVGLMGIGSGSSGPAGGGYVYILPTATADRLGGVKIGEGIDVENDGTISADSQMIADTVAAQDGEVTEMINEVFGPGEPEGTEGPGEGSGQEEGFNG